MQKLIDFFLGKTAKKSKDVFIGIIDENGAVKSSSEEGASMAFTLFAYTKNGSGIIEEDIYVIKEIESLNEEIKGLEPLSIVRISGDEFRHHGQKRIKLSKLLESDVTHKSLEEVLLNRKEPVVYKSATLGKFELDRRLDWFEGKTEWNDKTIDVFLVGGLGLLNDIEKSAIHVIQNHQDWDSYIKSKIGEELLSLKNESWLKENEKPWTIGEFLLKVQLESIIIDDMAFIQMYFSDGGAFWGHSIAVEVDINKNIEHIGIVG